jgi:hypothetical protein
MQADLALDLGHVDTSRAPSAPRAGMAALTKRVTVGHSVWSLPALKNSIFG